MDEEFGAGYAPTLASQQHLTALNGRTVDEALAAGVLPRVVWQAVCEQMAIPESRRLGVDHPSGPPGRD